MSARNLVIRYVGPNAVPWEMCPGVDVLAIHWGDTRDNIVERTWSLFDDHPRRRKFGSVAWALMDQRKDLFYFERYDRLMFADDDLVPVACTVADMFALFEKSEAHVAHPALTRDSHYSHASSLQPEPTRGNGRRAFPVWSPVPFCELMAPMFTRAVLLGYMFPHFTENVSGWGLEQMWAHCERREGREVLRLDDTPFRHTRPVGTGSAYNGHDAAAEAAAFMLRHGIPFPEHMRGMT